MSRFSTIITVIPWFSTLSSLFRGVPRHPHVFHFHHRYSTVFHIIPMLSTLSRPCQGCSRRHPHATVVHVLTPTPGCPTSSLPPVTILRCHQPHATVSHIIMPMTWFSTSSLPYATVIHAVNPMPRCSTLISPMPRFSRHHHYSAVFHSGEGDVRVAEARNGSRGRRVS